MKRKLLTFVVLLVAMLLTAAPVTKDAARQTALQFLTERGSSVAASRGVQPIELQLCDGIATDQLHVFNVGQQEGFVIISGDDATIPILGFSDSGSIDPNNMPPNMKAWLMGYADQIKWMQEHGNTAKARTTAPKKAPKRIGSHNTATIGPLLTTQWNQGEPYNEYCPALSQTSVCVTGCVATAMAQVMYYTETQAGNSTTKTTAEIPGYVWNYNNTLYQLNPIAAESTLNWSNMATNSQAIATLMKYCGWSVEMDYGLNGSEAQTFKVATALKSYFGYSSTTQYVSRSYYSYADWTDLIYNELNQRRPVIYGGQSVDNGHTFVCDGYQYQEGDKFHINWGWGGQCDGYYALSALAPTDQGIGGSSSGSGYTFGHEAIVGIQKNGGTGTVLNVANTVNMTINSILLSRNNIGLGETIDITVNVTNNSSDTFDGDIVFSVNENIAYGANVIVPANTTQNCVISYTPRFTGTATIQPLIANGEGRYATDNVNIKATLSVGDAMPYNLTASNITNTTADIGWTSVEEGTKWNVRSRQLSITEVDFNDGLPTDWEANYSQEGDYWIFTPDIKLGGSISFWAGGEGLSGEFALYRNNGVNYSSISQSFTVSDTPQQYTVDLSGYSGTTNLAFILKNTNGNTVALNNVTIIEPASDWVTAENITTNPYTLTGLTWERNYEVQVQAVFDAATTGWSESVIFSTPRITPDDITAVPTYQSALISWTGYTESYKVKYRTAAKETMIFSDDFENWNAKGWTQNGVGSWYSGDNKFVGLGNNTMSANYLITPELTNIENAIVKFKQRYYQSATTFKVGFSSTTADIAAFTWGDDQQAANTFTLYSEAIPEDTKYIAIQTTAEAGANTLFIDDFSIVTVTSAGEWTTLPTSESSVNITELTANTTYDYQVVGVTGEVEVSRSQILTFTTPDVTPIDLAAIPTNQSALISWTGYTDSYKVKYRTAATGTIPFSDDFNNSNTKGWTISDPSFVYFTGQESDKFIGLGYHSTGTNYLITPELSNIESGSTVNFYQSYNQKGTTFNVGFSSTTADITAFTWGSDQTAAYTFTLYSEVIPNGTKYIAIRTIAAEQANALFIDNFSISNLTPAGDWTTTEATNNSSISITGLAANTAYDYQVIGINGGEEIVTSATATFTTASSNAIILANDDSEAGTTNAELIAAWNGVATNVTLTGRTLLGNNQWNTMCLPFNISKTELTNYLATIIGSTPTVTCKVFDTEKTSLKTDGELTLTFTDAETIYAGTPFIIKFNTAADVNLSSYPLSVTIDGSNTAIERMTQTSGDGKVKFVGQWSSFDITDENINEIIYVSSDNKIGYSSKARTLKALRAHFWVQPNSTGVRSIILDLGDGDVTSIDLVNGGTTTRQYSGWYSLDGRHLLGEPTEKGVYIVNGKKVIK